MLSTIKQRLGRDEEQGFTLIELMVVVLIIAILLAIAIPTFLGARNTANQRAAQSNLGNALIAEQTAYAQNQSFSDNTGSVMTAIEPNLTWNTEAAATSTGNAVSAFTAQATTGVTTSDYVYLQALSKDGHCYTVLQVNNPSLTSPETGYNEGGATCSAPATAEPTSSTISSGSAGAHIGTSFYTTW
jgi:type IV pilus assembly protein PilA